MQYLKSLFKNSGALFSLISGVIVALVGAWSGYGIEKSRVDHLVWGKYFEQAVNPKIDNMERLPVLLYMVEHQSDLGPIEKDWVVGQFCQTWMNTRSNFTVLELNINERAGERPVLNLKESKVDCEGRSNTDLCNDAQNVLMRNNQLWNLYACGVDVYCNGKKRSTSSRCDTAIELGE